MLKLALIFVVTLATTSQSPAKLSELRQGPIEFRCDTMKVLSNPNKSICHRNVVVRRGDLLLCCKNFTGYADKDWAWTHFSCSGDVRAQRSGETAWSDNATFDLASSNLVLTGSPLLKRGKSYLQGTKITLNVTSDRAQVQKPRGIMVSNPEPTPASKQGTAGELPSQCPLPSRPTN